MMTTNEKLTITKRIIVLCWAMLVVCFAVKLFCPNLINEIVLSKNFLKFCDLINNSMILQYIVGCITTFTATTIYIMALKQCRRLTKRHLFATAIAVLIICLAKLFNNLYLNFILDIILFIALPIMLGATIKFTICGYFINWIFQIASVFIKSNKIIIADTCTALVMCIDLYIMLILFWLYTNLLKEKNMGIFYGFLMDATIDELNKMKNETIIALENTQNVKKREQLNQKLRAIYEKIIERLLEQ